MLSYTEIMYLQAQITKKLYQEGDCLRKLVAHKELLMRLRPLAEIADQEMWKAREGAERALEEANCWLEIGQYERLRMFEDRICIRSNADRFSLLTLEDSEARTTQGANEYSG